MPLYNDYARACIFVLYKWTRILKEKRITKTFNKCLNIQLNSTSDHLYAFFVIAEYESYFDYDNSR